MRNFLVHEYFNIDQAVVEDVITNDLDQLSTAVIALLDITEEPCLERRLVGRQAISHIFTGAFGPCSH